MSQAAARRYIDAARAPARKAGKSFIATVLMQLRRALKAGVLEKSKPADIVRVAANLLAGSAAAARRTAHVDEVRRFAQRYGIAIDPVVVDEIAEEEFTAGEWLTSEGIGRLLTLTAADQERLKLWTIGVHGETLQDQKARTQARRDAKAAAKAQDREIAKGPFHVNIAKAARDFGLSRPTVMKHHGAWEKAVVAGEFDGKFYTFLASSISSKNTINVAGRMWKISALMTKLDRSERTIHRWCKIPGKIEAEIARIAGKRPSRPRKAGGITPVYSRDATFPGSAARVVTDPAAITRSIEIPDLQVAFANNLRVLAERIPGTIERRIVELKNALQSGAASRA